MRKKIENLEILGILCGQLQPRKEGKKKHEVSFPLDAEDEDTSLLDRALAFLWAQKKRRIKEKGTNTVFHPRMESNMSILSL